MKREEIKEGEIYIYKYENNFYSYIFRASKDLRHCTDLRPWLKSLLMSDYSMIKGYKIHPATEEQIIWFEYCESIGEYRELEEALEKYYVRQFITEYLNEDINII